MNKHANVVLHKVLQPKTITECRLQMGMKLAKNHAGTTLCC